MINIKQGNKKINVKKLSKKDYKKRLKKIKKKRRTKLKIILYQMMKIKKHQAKK